jgi:hypothetical protein
MGKNRIQSLWVLDGRLFWMKHGPLRGVVISVLLVGVLFLALRGFYPGNQRNFYREDFDNGLRALHGALVAYCGDHRGEWPTTLSGLIDGGYMDVAGTEEPLDITRTDRMLGRDRRMPRQVFRAFEYLGKPVTTQPVRTSTTQEGQRVPLARCAPPVNGARGAEAVMILYSDGTIELEK